MNIEGNRLFEGACCRLAKPSTVGRDMQPARRSFWPDLHDDVFQQLLEVLAPADIAAVRLTCTVWRDKAYRLLQVCYQLLLYSVVSCA